MNDFAFEAKPQEARLLDGRRATPGNASQVVDINTIPALAIERVETITGGTGADKVTLAAAATAAMVAATGANSPVPLARSIRYSAA